MRLPVCNFDIESNMLCTNCQDRLDRGEITQFDVDFSRWLLEREKEYPTLTDLHLLRAIKSGNRIILVVKKRQRPLLVSLESLIAEITDEFGEVLVFEGPTKLRKLVRTLIAPAVEVGVNSLYLPDGFKESIVMLRDEDRDRIEYTIEELRNIVSAIMGESVLFQYQGDRVKQGEEETEDEFDERMKELGKGPPSRRR